MCVTVSKYHYLMIYHCIMLMLWVLSNVINLLDCQHNLDSSDVLQ